METKNFSEKLRARIEQMRMSQKEVAHQMGWRETQVSDALRLNRLPKPIRLLRLARTLGVTVEYLIDDEIAVGAIPGLSDEDRRILELTHEIGYRESVRRLTLAWDEGKVYDRDWGGEKIQPEMQKNGNGK